ncbi:DUF6578 domain-containing protein [Streptomyces sp. NPDC001919]
MHCRYGVPPGATDKVNYPVPGATVLVPVEKADGWAKARPGVSFAGYLVTARRITDLAGRCGCSRSMMGAADACQMRARSSGQSRSPEDRCGVRGLS